MDEEPDEAVTLLGRSRGSRRITKTRYAACIIVFAVLVSAALCLAVGLGVGYGLSSSVSDNGDGSSGTYEHAAVATDAARCSQVGADMLRKGGSAVDAAIASLLCVGVINLHSTGIGGGGFMVLYNATNKTATAIDHRETAPGRANSSMYSPFGPNETASLYGISAFNLLSSYAHSDPVN